MKLTIINGNGNSDHDVAVHRADCKDVAKKTRGHDFFTEEHDSKHSAWYEYNADFIDEGSSAWYLHFHACTNGLPAGGEYNI